MILNQKISTKLKQKYEIHHDVEIENVNHKVSLLKQKIGKIRGQLDPTKRITEEMGWVNDTHQFNLKLKRYYFAFALNASTELVPADKVRELVEAAVPTMGKNLFKIVSSRVEKKHNLLSKINFELKTGSFHHLIGAPLSHKKAIDRIIKIGIFSKRGK